LSASDDDVGPAAAGAVIHATVVKASAAAVVQHAFMIDLQIFLSVIRRL